MVTPTPPEEPTPAVDPAELPQPPEAVQPTEPTDVADPTEVAEPATPAEGPDVPEPTDGVEPAEADVPEPTDEDRAADLAGLARPWRRGEPAPAELSAAEAQGTQPDEAAESSEATAATPPVPEPATEPDAEEVADQTPTRMDRSLLAGAALIAGFAAFALARWALLPGLGFWDTGEFQVVGPALGTAHPTGFPAYVLLSWLASVLFQPFGDPAFRVNLLSAVLVGGATALTVVLVRQLTGHVWIALAAGLVLAALPVAWNIGTHADAHALHVLLVALLFVLLVGWEQRVRRGRTEPAPVGRLRRPGDRWLLAAALVYGVGLANHTLMLLLAPGIGLYVLATAPGILRRPLFIVGLAASLLLAAVALYLELPLRAGPFRGPLVYGHPETLDGFLYVVLAQQFVGALYQPFADLGDKTVALAKLGYEQFGLLVGLVPLAYVLTIWRQPRYALLSGVSFLITAWFAASYFNADISRYYLGPAVMAISWLAILAAEVTEWLVRLMRAGSDAAQARRGWLGTAGPAALVLEIAVCVALLTPTAEAIPDRASTADLSGQHSAADWAHTAMNLFEPDAVVISWWSYSTTLWYAQIIEGQRPDVWIVDDRTRLDDNLGDVTDVIEAELGKRPVYLVRLGGEDLTTIYDRYDVRGFDMPTEQPVLQVVGRKAP